MLVGNRDVVGGDMNQRDKNWEVSIRFTDLLVEEEIG